jgi:DNA segregation ATPase FtsK/SpoIIIE, S-DNA-T family
LARREQSGHDDAPAVYLFIYDVARFRDLRKGEDDFGLSRLDDNAPPDPARQFRTILREGPALGIHVLVWADGYTSVNRSFDRQGLEDFEMRVLFRMNAADASSLMDVPTAAQLGVHRAIFADEGQGLNEKFRPYGPPTAEWLEWVAGQLRRHCPVRAEPAGQGPAG